MRLMKPTLLYLGRPKASEEFLKMFGTSFALVSRDGTARDPVFSLNENLASADAIIAFPSAHPVQLVSLLAEAEVVNPFLQHEFDPTLRVENNIKPIVFLGSADDWAPFHSCFESMKREGLLRDRFNKLSLTTASLEEAKTYIEARLPKKISSGRLHFFRHIMQSEPTLLDRNPHAVAPKPMTLSIFGSASSKDPRHLVRADRVAEIAKKQEFNILHGGAVTGVMGRLSVAGRQSGVYVFGVTVSAGGAIGLSIFEQQQGPGRPEEVDEYLKSKDMIHRIETYALCSHAFLSLDGGVGSLQEILMIAQLRYESHPAMLFDTTSGNRAKKLLLALDVDGLWTPTVAYLRANGWPHLAEEITLVSNLEELETTLKAFFGANHARREIDRAQLRAVYFA